MYLCAARPGHKELATLLLNRKANPQAANKAGVTVEVGIFNNFYIHACMAVSNVICSLDPSPKAVLL